MQRLELPEVFRQRRQGIKRQNCDVANHSSAGYSNLFCVGISHRTANVDARERYLSRRPGESLRTDCGCAEAVMLATCNRVELYAAARDIVTTEQVARCLARREAPHGEDGSGFYRYEGEECVRHLFRVVCGLDSIVIGETEILGQVKKAYALAHESGSAGPLLHRLFQRAFHVAKQVRSRTEITRGSVSVASVVGDLAIKIFRDVAQPKVLLLGAGKMSERTARALRARGGERHPGEQSLFRAGGTPGGIGARSRRCIPALA